LEAILSEKNGTNGAALHPPTSLAAWNEYNTQTIPVSEKLAFEIAGMDVLALLTQGTNPLLAIIQDIVGKEEQGITTDGNLDMKMLQAEPEKLKALVESLDKILIDIVINPPLKEQGNPDGLPLIRIPTNFKWKIFQEISGGEAALDATQTFPQAEAVSLVVASAGNGLRENA
jgi:hypothetical protein